MEITDRRNGIMALRDLLFSYNIVFVGDEGFKQAYTDFMKIEGIVSRCQPRNRTSMYGSCAD